MSTSENVQISGIEDQHGIRHVIVTKEDASTFLSMSEVAEMKAISKLAQLGIVLPSGKRRSAFFERLADLGSFQKTHVIDQVGWHPGTFVLGDGSQIQARGAQPLLSLHQTQPGKWSVAGTLGGWRRKVARPLTGQPIPMFVLMLAFAPPIMKYLPQWTNPGFELVGRGGTGKSTLLKLAASVYGGTGDGVVGRYWETWNTTTAGVETLLEGHTNCLLILDELNALTGSGTTAAKRQTYNSILFNLSLGVDKTRYQAKADRQRPICYLSSSNTSLVQELAGGDQEVVRAAADRLLTIRADAGTGNGVFSHIPDAYEGAAELINAVMTGARRNHGVAIRAYLERLVQDEAEDAVKLQALLSSWAGDFIQRVTRHRASGSESRTVQVFSLVYAAGKLAQSYGILPTEWMCGGAVETCFRRHIEEKTLSLGSAPDRILAYAALPDVKAVDSLGDVSTAALRRRAGVLVGKGPNRELVLHPDALRERLSGSLHLLKALKAAGMLDGDAGTYQTKRTIQGRSVRVVVVKVPE